MSLALAGFLGAGFLGAGAVESQARHQTMDAALREAQMVSAITANRAVPDLVSPVGGVDTVAVADLEADVSALVSRHDLLGLSILWPDGTVIYQDGTAALAQPSLLELSRAAFGEPQTMFTSARTGRHHGTIAVLEVLVPLSSAGQPFERPVAGLVFPISAIAAGTDWATDALVAAIVTIALLCCLGLVTLHRRMHYQTFHAHHDRLTTLGNRLMLEEAADRCMNGTAPVCVAVLDLDGFKQVNDTLGHSAGDDLLVALAASLRGNVRPDDVLVRLGGDEFAVLMPGLPPEAADSTGRRLLSAVRRQFSVGGALVGTDASIGMAMYPGDGADLRSLLRAADLAMYRAKRDNLGVVSYASELSNPDLYETAVGEHR
jgi:diguanylate cyclase (GGDEF)-like protein